MLSTFLKIDQFRSENIKLLFQITNKSNFQKAKMVMIADHLVEIQHKDLPILREMYNSPGGRTHTAYTTIDNYIRWIENGPEERKFIKFYSLNGDFSDGTFAVTVSITFSVDAFSKI